MGAARLGVGASTAGIYAALGVIGNQYTTAINEGKSPDTAMFHAGASGGISGGIEIVGGGLIKQALKNKENFLKLIDNNDKLPSVCKTMCETNKDKDNT